MTTRTKLIILVLMTSVAGISSLLVNRLMLHPVSRIENENRILVNLKAEMVDYVSRINKLDTEPFRAQLEQVRAGKSNLDEAYEAVKGLEFLPSVNPSIKASIDAILLYATSMTFTQKTLDERIEVVLKTAGDVLGDDEDFTVLQLTWNVDRSDDKAYEAVQGSVFALVSGIAGLNRNISNILENVEAQFVIINGEIAKYKQQAGILIFLAIFFMVAIPLVFALIIANRLAGRIQRIDIGISRMKDGDLADRINVRSRDEMGRLSENVNSFTDELSRSMLQIKEASRNNIKIKEALLESVGRVSETTDQVNESASSILSGMDKLKETVDITDAAGETVEEQLNRLESVLNEQVAMVEESTASITEMITSVGNVSEIVRKKKEAFTHLVGFSGEGGSKLKETNEIIALIHDSVEQIRGTTKIISGIAGQTNLLAMNAAIEAAHAGEAGQGFAVVAQEIRSLAEATSKNSNQINGIMKAIITNIEAAVESGKNTGEAFGKINNEVVETSQAFDEIVQSMEELRIGGQQILDAMVRLNDFSGQVKDGDVSIRAASSDNRKAIENLEAISQITNQQIAEITKAISSLAAEMDTVTSMTRKADDISRSLQNEVSRYKVSDFEKGNEGEIN